MSRSPCLVLSLLAGICVLSLVPGAARGQMLRFDNYRDLVIPDNANIRFGNFYSDWSFAQSVGIRHTQSSGEGTTYLGSLDLGRAREDGIEYPTVSTLSMKNYLLINKYMDLDLSFNVTYSYFPMGTEDDQLDFNIVGEGLSARMGAFTMGVGRDSLTGGFNGRNVTANAYTRSDSDKASGVSANLSTEIDLTKHVRARIYDTPSYTTEYVDRRGRSDDLRGEKYRYFQNTLGLDIDWLLAKNQELAYTFARLDTWPQDNDLNQARSTVTKHSLIYQNQLTPVLMVGARGDFIWRVFEETLRGNQFQQDYLGFLGADLSENTTLSVGGGYSMASLDDPGPFEQEGGSDATIGFASLGSMLTERTAHSIGYSRKQEGGFEGGFEIIDQYRYAIEWNNNVWSWSFLTQYETVEPRLATVSEYSDWLNQVVMTRVLTRTLTGIVNFAHTVRRNGEIEAGDLNADNPFITQDYTTWAVNAGLTQRLTDHLAAYYYAEHLVQSGDDVSMDLERDTVGATLTYQHDF
jgi:hypothetical protein